MEADGVCAYGVLITALFFLEIDKQQPSLDLMFIAVYSSYDATLGLD